jgi:hypothetical protein
MTRKITDLLTSPKLHYQQFSAHTFFLWESTLGCSLSGVGTVHQSTGGVYSHRCWYGPLPTYGAVHFPLGIWHSGVVAVHGCGSREAERMDNARLTQEGTRPGREF